MHPRSPSFFASAVAAVALATSVSAADPDLPDGTEAAKKAMAGFRTPAGFVVRLFAAEPMLSSPVAICLDERGRVFVAEEYRFNRGTEENRTRPFLLEDDLQIKTVDERLAMYKKWAAKFEGGMDWFSRQADQVRMLEDRSGSGKADFSTVFAGGFNDPLDGLAAGVIARDGKVWLTCIPHLWQLEDTKGAGTADVRKPLLRGFGVNAGFLGHDLHGLTWGPDGRLYFSVGDRGFHVETKEGKTLHGPRTGAVFRCEPDGSHLEVVARGLRNPQGLAFDQYGNLFADDNNCDKGDHSRLVWVVEGGHSGWNMSYQSLGEPYLTGPWHAERMWHLPHAGQPAWIVPPVGKIGAGPSGFCFSSGVGQPARYRNKFFMCNYTGNGGVECFGVQPAGAGFEITDPHDFLKPIMATDCQFGYDGKMYVSDFVGLDWSGKTKGGRLYTVFDPERIKDPAVEQTRKLFAEGFKDRPTDELAALLAHPDMRVRLRAQFTIVEREGDKATKRLETLAHKVKPDAGQDAALAQLARIHAIWGLSQLARKDTDAVANLRDLLTDPDAEIRAQTAKALGDAGCRAAGCELFRLMADPSPRVRFFAAMAAGDLQDECSLPAVATMLRDNDKDPFLRHAGVMALAGIAAIHGDEVHALAKDPSRAVRMGVLLAMRKAEDRWLSRFLDDPDPLIVTEAARAINDLMMDDLTPALAKAGVRFAPSPGGTLDPLVRRVINAHFRLGTADDATAVAEIAANPEHSPAVRGEALAALGDWSEPKPRDRVTGFWRPLEKRDPKIVREVLDGCAVRILGRSSGKLQTEAVKLIAKLDIKIDETEFLNWVADAKREPDARIAALRLLAIRHNPGTAGAAAEALAGTDPRLRAEARDVLADLKPEAAVESLAGALSAADATVVERQKAVGTLARMKLPKAAAALDEWMDKLAAGQAPGEIQLELLEAAKAAPSPRRAEAVKKFESLPAGGIKPAKFRPALVGGDAERGRALFVGHALAQCIRCHKVNGNGGDAGPDLTEVVKRNPTNTREYLLESMIDPNAKIAPGYGSTTMLLSDGRVISGVVKAETADAVTVLLPDGKTMAIPPGDIEQRKAPVSPMPPMDKTLTVRELRDLVEFLATVKPVTGHAAP